MSSSGIKKLFGSIKQKPTSSQRQEDATLDEALGSQSQHQSKWSTIFTKKSPASTTTAKLSKDKQSLKKSSSSIGKFSMEPLSNDDLTGDTEREIFSPQKSIKLNQGEQQAQLRPARKSIMLLKQSPSFNYINSTSGQEENIPSSELEYWCIAHALSVLPSHKLLKNEVHEELLTAVIANMSYVELKSELKPITDYEIEMLKRSLNQHIEKCISKVLKKKNQYIADKELVVGSSGSFTEKGLRQGNEDRHVVMPHLHELVGIYPAPHALSLYGVFDGHGGVQCANYVSSHLPLNIIRSEKLAEDPRAAIYEAFMQTNEQWKDQQLRTEMSEACGTTAVVALFNERNLYVAWAGDSSAMMFLKNGVWLDFIIPHKPGSDIERQRIESYGGFVQSDRVNGILAVSRAFGDLRYGCVFPEPDIVQYALQGQELFLILACDGLTDVMTPIDILDTVRRTQNEKNGENLVAKRLVDAALNRGSTDNVSVIYIPLQHVMPDVPSPPIPQAPSRISPVLYSQVVQGNLQPLDGVGIFAKQPEVKPKSQTLSNAQNKNGSIVWAPNSQKSMTDDTNVDIDGDATPPMDPDDMEPEPEFNATKFNINSRAMTNTRKQDAGSNTSLQKTDLTSTSRRDSVDPFTTTGSVSKSIKVVATQSTTNYSNNSRVSQWKDPNIHALSELSALAALSKQFGATSINTNTMQDMPQKAPSQVQKQPQVLQSMGNSEDFDITSEYGISFSAYDEEVSPFTTSGPSFSQRTQKQYQQAESTSNQLTKVNTSSSEDTAASIDQTYVKQVEVVKRDSKAAVEQVLDSYQQI